MVPVNAVTYLKSCEFKNSKLKLGIQELETVVNGVMANGVIRITTPRSQFPDYAY